MPTRFALGSAALFAYAQLGGRRVRVPRDRYPIVMLQGMLLFSASYCLVYHGTAFVTSGLVAVLFSAIVLCNAFFERLFFRTPVERRLLLAAVFGIGGIALVFWPEVARLSLRDETITGILWIAAAIIAASLGNMTAVVNLRGEQPVIAVNAHAMAWAL
ncbi:MAG: DMT family transporter [Woeseiaceae bacterium]|nr:DMT family transporter [Woeseiaceae bacterium]